MAETLNMVEAPIGQITDFIKDLLAMEIYDPVIILGKMGMGKTASLKGLAKELGIGYSELRLVNMTETDMLGIPTISAEGTTTYASNDLLPIAERDGEVGILAIDEITSCSSVMRAAAYQLLDGQRKLGNYKLPDKWICVGLGNGPDDGGVFNGAEAALFTRCYAFRVAISLDSWKEWAISSGINPAVIAYLSFNPAALHVYDPDELDGICPTPRTWEKLSKLLNAKEKRNGGKPLGRDTARFLAEASIGVREAGNFTGFYKYTEKAELVSPADILEGRAKGAEVGRMESEVVYLAIESLISEMNKELASTKDPSGEYSDAEIRRMANAAQWIIDAGKVTLDYGIMGIRDIGNGVDGFTEIVVMDERFDKMCPDFLQFAVDNSIVFQ